MKRDGPSPAAFNMKYSESSSALKQLLAVKDFNLSMEINEPDEFVVTQRQEIAGPVLQTRELPTSNL